MVRRFKALFSPLGARLLVPLFLSMGAVLAIHAFVSFASIRSHFLGFVGGEAQRSSGLIRRATHDGMLLNRLDEVQTTIERLAEGPDVAVIRVFDKQGQIVLSSDRGEIGRYISLDAAPCTSCHEAHGPADTVRSEAADMIPAGGGEVLRQLSVIPNEPACSSGACHTGAAADAVLGVLDVQMSMAPVESTLRSARLLLIWTTLVLVLLLAVVAAFLFRHLIHHPIERLQEAARRIAGGDLQTRIDVQGEQHELARLARDFNRMAEDLSHAQEALTEWSDSLEEKVAEKTQELQEAQRQVMHMEKMASLGKLSATVAHELNNPISGMLTYTRLIERGLSEQHLDDEAQAELERYLRLVQQECVRCGDIVKNLLVFARRSGGTMESVDVNEIVDRSLMLVRHHLDISGIQLETDLLEGNPRLVADAGQIQQALVALLVNAVEAMSEGGVLGVHLRETPDGVLIEVTDTGSGIAPDVLPFIFEPFFSTKGAESGVGLGLAVVYGIVHRHGGTIEVDSRQGAGTAFRIRLPRVPPASHEDTTGAEPPGEMALPSSSDG